MSFVFGVAAACAEREQRAPIQVTEDENGRRAI